MGLTPPRLDLEGTFPTALTNRWNTCTILSLLTSIVCSLATINLFN
jgi:hypothetical protein